MSKLVVCVTKMIQEIVNLELAIYFLSGSINTVSGNYQFK